MPAALSPDHILKELNELWTSLAKPGEPETGAGVLRACTMTLIVIAEGADDPAALGETLAALMPEHPARTAIVRLNGAGERGLDSRVYAQCWMPFGQRRQICCEQIEITCPDASLGDLASVVLPLAVPDMPVVVWCRSARVVGMPEFRSIAAVATKVIVDTAGFADPRSALASIAGLTRAVIVGDLAWTRLTRLREMLALVFENRHFLDHLPRVGQARVSYGGGAVPVSALYLAAWLRNALADAGALPNVSWGRDAALDPGSLPRIELEGDDFRLVFEQQPGRLLVTQDDKTECTNVPELTDYLLMREELNILHTDPVFRRTLASAASLAYPTDK